MRKALPALIALVLTLMPMAAAAEGGRVLLGFGRLFSNDGLGDLRDRWRTGAYVVSAVTGPVWRGDLPARPFEILEYRFRGEIAAPANLANPGAGDRRYAGVLSLGVHTHFQAAGFETRLGLDVVATGPSTGVGRFQRWVHDILDVPQPDLGNQIPDGLHPMLSAEVARTLPLGGARLRPFVEAQAGYETLVRGGFDLTFGRFGEGRLMLRDTTTGQRYAGTRADDTHGFSFVLGADVARVWDSALLPSGGPALRDTRERVRAGVHWQGGRGEVFYGLTWLGREFEGQPEGQAVGSIRLRLRF